MLWLALHFPLLPLEALTRGEDGARPLALEVARRLRLVNATAREAGVRADMSINAALALAPDLRVLARREADEERALHGLATWALQFSPQISLVEGEGMLLEIGASLRLFGGLDALLDTIRAGVPTLGFSVRDAVAPTPAAAWMGAWLGVPLRIDSSDRLTAALAGWMFPRCGCRRNRNRACAAWVCTGSGSCCVCRARAGAAHRHGCAGSSRSRAGP